MHPRPKRFYRYRTMQNCFILILHHRHMDLKELTYSTFDKNSCNLGFLGAPKYMFCLFAGPELEVKKYVF